MASGGRFLSGEDLSRELGISRTAIWKRIASLKKEGYPIEASTKKGYRILSLEAHYGKSGIQSLLETRFLGRELKFHQTIDSTNQALKILAMEEAPEGTVVLSDRQEKGKGRLGRTWMSEPGKGIWMSLLLRPQLHPAMVQSLTLAAAVAVCQAIEPYCRNKPGIKWPNDILIDGKKVCGILTEMSAEADRVLWVVVGIGLNVHHNKEDFPLELRETATSMKLHGNVDHAISRSTLTARILNAFEAIYCDYLLNGPLKMLKEWKERSVTLGRMVSLHKGDEVRRAKVLDIGEDGRLIVELEDGQITEVISGEITLRPL